MHGRDDPGTPKDPETIWMNGALRPWAEATTHVMAHALHYGSSVFEGVRVYAREGDRPAFFRLEDHLRRLEDSARIHRMPLPHDRAALRRACHEVVAANGLDSAYVRPFAWRGTGTLGLDPTPATVEVAVAAVRWGTYLGADALEHGVDAGIVSWNRPAPNTFPTLAKAGGNYLASQLMTMEAKRNGFAEGIALCVDGTLSEGAGQNVFVVRDEVLYTTPLASSILGGITRDTVVTLARQRGYEIREQPLLREILYVADEVFMTGTASEITPVRSVDAIQVGAGRPHEGARGPVTEQLQRDFFGLFSGEVRDAWGWLEPLEVEAGSA